MSVNPGEVEIKLDGKTATLRPTLQAARDVNGRLGGFVEAFKKLSGFDMDAYCIVVAAGLGKKMQDVEASVFKTGVVNLTEPLARFVSILANGGREPSGDKPQEGEG